jgi:ABC-type multidrug transport system fused ATPase/permease subunit
MSASVSTLTLLRGLWRHMTPRRHRQFVAVMVLTLASALLEVVSLGAALPFIAVLAAPDAAFRFRLVALAGHMLGVHNGQQLLVPLTAAFVLAAVVAAAVRLLWSWASTRFTFATGAELSEEVYLRTLYQPYEVHIRRSSSEIISGIATKIGGTMLGVLLPGLTLASALMVLVAIMLTLVIVDPLAATIAAVGFGFSYGLVSWVTNQRLRRNSRLIASEQTYVIKALQEGLGGIRDVLLDSAQPFYCEVYRRADLTLRRAQGSNVFIQQCPRPLIEAFGMILIAALAFGMSRRAGGIAAALPVLVALALGAQRLLPALQQAYTSWASIIGSQAVLADTIDLLDQPLPPLALEPPPRPLPLNHSIQLAALRFRYGPDCPWAIEDLELTIPRGARVGFVGTTGGGKSTAMDLLMGLLTPTQGEVRVDGEALTGDRVRAWQRTVAHVPQSIYLADASMAENIAFGVARSKIDMGRVRVAAKKAQLAELIESRPHGYDEIVGERGVRLSGGQRQRIGIARALYKQASVLVLDEATSALDNLTERSVLEAIEAIGRDMTILIIAHRLSTVQHCDTVVQLESGRVVAQGSYEELLEASHTFRQMARASAVT